MTLAQKKDGGDVVQQRDFRSVTTDQPDPTGESISITADDVHEDAGKCFPSPRQAASINIDSRADAQWVEMI